MPAGQKGQVPTALSESCRPGPSTPRSPHTVSHTGEARAGCGPQGPPDAGHRGHLGAHLPLGNLRTLEDESESAANVLELPILTCPKVNPGAKAEALGEHKGQVLPRSARNFPKRIKTDSTVFSENKATRPLASTESPRVCPRPPGTGPDRVDGRLRSRPGAQAPTAPVLTVVNVQRPHGLGEGRPRGAKAGVRKGGPHGKQEGAGSRRATPAGKESPENLPTFQNPKSWGPGAPG